MLLSLVTLLALAIQSLGPYLGWMALVLFIAVVLPAGLRSSSRFPTPTPATPKRETKEEAVEGILSVLDQAARQKVVQEQRAAAEEAWLVATLPEEERLAFRSNPERHLLEKLQTQGYRCHRIDLLRSMTAFVALSRERKNVVLGRVNRDGDIKSIDVIPFSDIVSFKGHTDAEAWAVTPEDATVDIYGGTAPRKRPDGSQPRRPRQDSYVNLFLPGSTRRIVFSSVNARMSWQRRLSQLLRKNKGNS